MSDITDQDVSELLQMAIDPASPAIVCEAARQTPGLLDRLMAFSKAESEKDRSGHTIATDADRISRVLERLGY